MYRIQNGLIAEHWDHVPKSKAALSFDPNTRIEEEVTPCAGPRADAAWSPAPCDAGGHGAATGEPAISDSRVITEERRVQLLEAKLASLQQQINLIEDHKAIERLQQMWGHYVSEGHGARSGGAVLGQPGGLHRIRAAGRLPGQGAHRSLPRRPAARSWRRVSCAKHR